MCSPLAGPTLRLVSFPLYLFVTAFHSGPVSKYLRMAILALALEKAGESVKDLTVAFAAKKLGLKYLGSFEGL